MLAATPDAAAQLMELSETKAIGVLDHHHRGVGDVHAHFDHRCGDQHVEVSRRKRGHHTLTIPGGHLAVRAGHTKTVEWTASQALGLLFGSACLNVGVLLNERADDVGLSPRRDLLADPAVAVFALGLGDDARLDWFATGWQLVDHAQVQVAEGRQSQRAWNRGGRHVQDVRHSLAPC